MNKPTIFIASPLFNPEQIEIIKTIETLLEVNGFDFYSARLHSGSADMTLEQRKDIRAWDPVFKSNEEGLNSCQTMIAVLEYALPEGQRLSLVEDVPGYDTGIGEREGFLKEHVSLELPDAGTVWECGYHRAQGKLVFGFHRDTAKHLNLMLSHGCDGIVKGFENLEKLLSSKATIIPKNVLDRDVPGILDLATEFDWTATQDWDKEVE